MFFLTRRCPIFSIYLSVHLNLICVHLRKSAATVFSVSLRVLGGKSSMVFSAAPRLRGEYFFAVTLRAFCEEWGSMHFVTVRSRTLANESEQPRSNLTHNLSDLKCFTVVRFWNVSCLS
jgi:hypothetical protein